jgi:hypothetical protein
MRTLPYITSRVLFDEREDPWRREALDPFSLYVAAPETA